MILWILISCICTKTDKDCEQQPKLHGVADKNTTIIKEKKRCKRMNF